MVKKLYVCVFLCLVFAGVSCAPQYVWKSEPNTYHAKNDFFDAEISPIYIVDGYKGFVLHIHNKTSNKIEVDWNKTFYIYNGETNGGFLFENMRAGDRGKSMPPDIVPDDALFSKEIFPGVLAEFSSLAMATVYTPMKPGENGVYLAVSAEGKEITEKLTVLLARE